MIWVLSLFILTVLTNIYKKILVNIRNQKQPHCQSFHDFESFNNKGHMFSPRQGWVGMCCTSKLLYMCLMYFLNIVHNDLTCVTALVAFVCEIQVTRPALRAYRGVWYLRSQTHTAACSDNIQDASVWGNIILHNVTFWKIMQSFTGTLDTSLPPTPAT